MALAYDEFNDDDNITGDVTYLYTADIEEITYVLQVYLTPILILVGVIGNLLSIIVFYKSKLRGQSTSQYLSALAVSDTIFLLQLIPPWLKAVKASMVFVRPGFCQLFVYLSYVSSANSSWLVVAFTVERFVAVIYPLRSRSCTVRRARVCIACVGASCVALNTPVLWFAQARGADCDIDRALMEHAARFNVLDTVLSFTLPLAITTVLNVWIMVGVCRGNRARRRLTRDARATAHPRAHLSRNRLARRTRSQLQRAQQRVTRMLLLVSSVFVLLNLPAYSMRIVAYAMNMSSYEYSGRWAVLQRICQLFFNANFGINFFLYCLSGQNFRSALLHTLPCVGRTTKMLRMILCCFPGEQPPTLPPPRASVTNTDSTHTEAESRAAVISVGDGRRAAASSCSTTTNERSVLGKPILKRWEFGTLRQKRNFQQFHNSCYHEMHYFHLRTRATRRPPVIEQAHSVDNINFRNRQLFKPIQYNLYPGEIAPLGPDFKPLSPGLAPSPSPLVSVERSDVSADKESAPAPSNATPIASHAIYFTPVIIEDERVFPLAHPVNNAERTISRLRANADPLWARGNPPGPRLGRRPLCPHAARAAARPGRRTM